METGYSTGDEAGHDGWPAKEAGSIGVHMTPPDVI
jgi:hypothetical protein